MPPISFPGLHALVLIHLTAMFGLNPTIEITFALNIQLSVKGTENKIYLIFTQIFTMYGPFIRTFV